MGLVLVLEVVDVCTHYDDLSESWIWPCFGHFQI
jgi:hypothetical protein